MPTDGRYIYPEFLRQNTRSIPRAVSPEDYEQMLRAESAQKARDVSHMARDPSGTYALLQQRQMEMMRQKAQIDAELLETRYTAKDKAEISKIESQKKRAWGLLQSGEISQEDFEKTNKILQSRSLGITPGQLPSLSPYAKGQNVGDFWDQGGVTVSRKQNGETWQVDEKKTARGAAQEQELKATEAKAKFDNQLEMKKWGFRERLASEKLVDPKDMTKVRYRTPQEIEEAVQRAYNGGQQQLQSFIKEPQDTPEHARKYISMMIDRWGNTPPLAVAEGIKQAQEVIRQSQAGQ